MLALMASLAVILSACGQKEEATPNEEKQENKTLRVVTAADYPPFEYRETGKIVGFDVELANAVAEEAGYKMEIEHVGFDPLFVEIDSKRADVAVSALSMNEERKQSYDFSYPYFLSTNKILVTKDSDIQGPEDLKGKVVGVQKGTTGQEAAEKIMGKNDKNIKKFEKNTLAIQELLQGGADAVVADNAVVEQYVKNNPDQNVKIVESDGQFDQEFYGMMFPKGSELKAEFDKALNNLYDNGKYTEIYQKWFGIEPDIETLKAQQ